MLARRRLSEYARAVRCLDRRGTDVVLAASTSHPDRPAVVRVRAGRLHMLLRESDPFPALGRRHAFVGGDGETVGFLDYSNGLVTSWPVGVQAPARDLALAPDERRAAFASRDLLAVVPRPHPGERETPHEILFVPGRYGPPIWLGPKRMLLFPLPGPAADARAILLSARLRLLGTVPPWDASLFAAQGRELWSVSAGGGLYHVRPPAPAQRVGLLPSGPVRALVPVSRASALRVRPR